MMTLPRLGRLAALILSACLIVIAPLGCRTTPEPTVDVPPTWAPRTAHCAKRDRPITIDGAIMPAEWAGTPWTTPFVDIEGDRKPAPRFATRARFAWDDDYLYVAVTMEEPHLWATLTERESVIFHDNDIELFIDPDDDTHEYFELEVNALNTVWDLLLVRPYRDGGPPVNAWDIDGLQTAVRLDGTLNDPTDTDRGWAIEIAVPWSAMADRAGRPCPPRSGDRWRVNMSRVEWHLDIDDGAYRKRTDSKGKALPEDNWVWSPQYAINMHAPEHWGILEFSDRTDVTDRAPPAIEAEDEVRWALRQVRNDVNRTMKTSGRPPHSLDRLPVTPAPSSGWSWPPVLDVTGRTYTLSTHRPDGRRLTIDHEGRVRAYDEMGNL